MLCLSVPVGKTFSNSFCAAVRVSLTRRFQSGPFTTNLPNNEAFQAMDPERLAYLSRPENIGELRQLVLYHILPGETRTEDFTAGPLDTLLANFPVNISVDPLMLDDSSILDPDNPASNGLFNIIDAVLDPLASACTFPLVVPRAHMNNNFTNCCFYICSW